MDAIETNFGDEIAVNVVQTENIHVKWKINSLPVLNINFAKIKIQHPHYKYALTRMNDLIMNFPITVCSKCHCEVEVEDDKCLLLWQWSTSPANPGSPLTSTTSPVHNSPSTSTPQQLPLTVHIT